MPKKIFLLLLISSLTACKKTTEEDKSNPQTELSFNKEKWAIKEADDYPYRENMLNDLITNVTLKGITKAQVTALLGTPDRTDNDYLFYTVAQERVGFFTLHATTLVLKLDKNGTVAWRKIHQ